MKQKILLTGASGSVGYETLKELLKRKNKYEISIFDIQTSKIRKNLKNKLSGVKIYEGDITKYEDVFNAVKNTDFIIHTAALIPPKADKYPEKAEKTNIKGTKNICDAVNKINPEIFVLFTSSISVYGDRINNPKIKVSDKLQPSEGDFYAVTKIKAEEIIKLNLKNFTIFRLSAVMHPKMKLDPLFFHMPLDTELEIVTAKDTAFALVEAVEKKEHLNNNIFNLGGGEKCRIKYEDFLEENFKIFGLKTLNFPKYAFAEKNFHCGIYEDSYILNEILNFQRDTKEDYFMSVKKEINPLKFFFTKILNKQIKKQLLKKSEPYKAYKSGNKKLTNRFFNEIPVK